MKNKIKQQIKKIIKEDSGFTLIELLIVIGIIAILAATIIISVNPARQFAQARNTQRQSDISSILNAVQQRMVDNTGNFAAGSTCDPLPSSASEIASSTTDLCDCLVPTYLAEMPFDPSATGAGYTDCNDYKTGYRIFQDSTTSRVTVSAPEAELEETISVTR